MAKAAARRTDGHAIPAYRFAGTWRGYQQRLLDELHRHLDDRKLHVVAAPGAGKTVIGLEVMRLLDRPALILSPTLGIREQWLARLRAMFVSDDPAWLEGAGTALAAPGWLTSSTYQSVHAALGGRDEDGEEDDAEDREDPGETAGGPLPEPPVADLLDRLSRAGVATLVLDEAHHLRRAWWESLQRVVAHLEKTAPGFHVVSLTATPPYDVEEAEWARYHQICGPIDAEISIPELVRQGDLCPHQDFVHFSFPRPSEVGAFETFAGEAEALATRWCVDAALAAWVEGHPWLRDPDSQGDVILDRPDLLGALLAVAEANGLKASRAAYGLIGSRPGSAPPASGRWLTPLFQAILDREAGSAVASDLVDRLAAELQAIGALWRGKVRLQKDEHLARALTRSAGKMESAVEVARAEFEALGQSLRLVILTDYIRAEALRRPEDRSNDRLGAGTVFRRLIATGLADAMHAALVTGTTMVVPAATAQALADEAGRQGLDEDTLSLRPLPELPGWLLFEVPAARRAIRVTIVTRLFEAGVLRCLVGTAALLGEGWDAPSINSLVLATSVKTYMLSNQMRGRAIRRQPEVPDKTAAIWHLATIIPPDMVLARDPRSAWARLMASVERPRAQGVLELAPEMLGRDARLVAQRFKTFAGVTHEPPFRVRSSVSRLGLRYPTWTAATVAQVNREMLARAANRPAIAAAWAEATGGAMRMERPAEGVESPPVDAAGYVWTMGIAALLAPLVAWAGYVLFLSESIARQMGPGPALLLGLALLVGGVAWNARRIWRLVSAGSPGRYLREIGRCILDGLHAADRLHTPRDHLSVTILNLGQPGVRYCAIEGGTRHDEAAFADAMAELLEPIRNPRQVLVRRTGHWWLRQVDYHAVPEAIGAEKAALAAFERGWRRRIGACEIHGTRTREGRRIMLRARARQYAAVFVAPAERLTIWE